MCFINKLKNNMEYVFFIYLDVLVKIDCDRGYVYFNGIDYYEVVEFLKEIFGI